MRPILKEDDRRAYEAALTAARTYYENPDALVADLEQLMKGGRSSAKAFYDLLKMKGILKRGEGPNSLQIDFGPFLKTTDFAEAPALPPSAATNRAANRAYTLACFEADRNFKDADALLGGLKILYEKGVTDIETYRAFLRQVGEPLIAGQYVEGTLNEAEVGANRLIRNFSERVRGGPKSAADLAARALRFVAQEKAVGRKVNVRDAVRHASAITA